MIKIAVPCLLLLIDLLYFFIRYPDWIDKYAGRINIGNGNLDLLTNEIVDFRVIFFIFLVALPSVFISWIIVGIYGYYEGKSNRILGDIKHK